MKFKIWHQATFNGIGQIAFSEKPFTGYLVLLAIVLISPWSALGCFVGSTTGTLISFLLEKNEKDKLWLKGYSGYNPAIVGIVLGSYISLEPINLLLFVSAIIICSLINPFVRNFLFKIFLPPFATTAVITIWMFYFAFLLTNKNFWFFKDVLPFKEIGVYLSVIIIFTVMIFNNKKAALTATFLTFLTMFLSFKILNLKPMDSSGLWAFTVATSSFFSAFIFINFKLFGLLIILSSVTVSSIIWYIWVYSGFWEIAPPIVFPFILGTWIVSLFINKYLGPIIFSPNITSIINEIKKYNKNDICVLTGAGVSTFSGIPDYVSGEWLEPERSKDDYNFQNFLKFKECRKTYWNVCHKFYRTVKKSKPNITHKILSDLEKRGFVNTIITQNVDGLHQTAGSKSVIELHGNIKKINCLVCNKPYKWEKLKKKWKKHDIVCDCGKSSYVKPSVIAMKQNLNPIVWSMAKLKVKNSKLLLILGTQLAITTATNLLRMARNNKNKIIVINRGSLAIPLQKRELFLYYPVEKFFRLLSILSY